MSIVFECARENLLGLPECLANTFSAEKILLESDLYGCTLCVPSIYKQIKAEKEAAEKEASTDQLTGALNRRGLNIEIQNMRRKGGRPGFIQYDIINFGDINRALGHHMGDKVLKKTVKILSGRREDDAVVRTKIPSDEENNTFRIGGDEFGTLMNLAEWDERREETLSDHERLVKSGFHFVDTFNEDPLIKRVNMMLADLGHEPVSVRIGVRPFHSDDTMEDGLHYSDPKQFEITERPITLQ